MARITLKLSASSMHDSEGPALTTINRVSKRLAEGADPRPEYLINRG